MTAQQAPDAQVMPGPATLTSPQQAMPPRLPGYAVPPPEIQALLNRPEALSQMPRQKPTVKMLIDRIRLLPGGPQKIEEAIKRGANLPLSDTFTPSFSCTMTPENPTTANPLECMWAYGAFVDADRSRYSLINRSYPSPYWGTSVSKPAIWFCVDIPTAGVYIVDVEASGEAASLWHYGWTNAESWSDDISGCYPTMLELDVDDHYFAWVVDSGSWASVSAVNIYSLH
jgi:hypothetical protein